MGNRLVKSKFFGIFDRHKLNSVLDDSNELQIIAITMPKPIFFVFTANLFANVYLSRPGFMSSFSPMRQKCLIGGILLSGIFAGIVLLDPAMEFIIDVRYRLDLAAYEFRQSESELAYCSSSPASCRSLNKRLKDAWLGFNSGRKKNPLLLYKRYKVYLR